MKKVIKYFPRVVSWLLALLFTYASVSKALDFENFQVQLAQSPLLSAYAGFISYAVLIVEIVVALMLITVRGNLIGLYASLGLMSAFTIYMYLILNFSDFIPCSCGGILEKLGWTEHLFFNLFFVALALAAIVISAFRFMGWKRPAIYSASIIVVSCLAVFFLFQSSEHIIKKENNFTRRFLFHPLEEEDAKIDLGFNSYYFAGVANGKIYLGNVTAPHILTTIDILLKEKRETRIILDKAGHPFKSLQVRVRAPYYYLYDGSVPVIYRGKLDNPNASTISHNDAYFNQLAVIDSTKFAIRTINSETGTCSLGLLDLSTKEKVQMYPNLLEKQIDGIFDSDGRLIQDDKTGKLAYIYFYRNQFIMMDSTLGLLRRLNTIDTTIRAKLEPVALSDGRHKMGAPPLVVNKNTILASDILFNQSGLRGKFEDKKAWKKASIIDCYSADRQHYIGSFYSSHHKGKAMSSMLVEDGSLYLMTDNIIRRYRIRDRALK